MLHSASALVFLFLRLSGNTDCDTWRHLYYRNHIFLQITAAALVFTIPLLFLLKVAAWRIYYLVMAGVYIVMLLVRICQIAKSLEDKMPWRGRVKSASEVDITRIRIEFENEL